MRSDYKKAGDNITMDVELITLIRIAIEKGLRFANYAGRNYTGKTTVRIGRRPQETIPFIDFKNVRRTISRLLLRSNTKRNIASKKTLILRA